MVSALWGPLSSTPNAPNQLLISQPSHLGGSPHSWGRTQGARKAQENLQHPHTCGAAPWRGRQGAEAVPEKKSMQTPFIGELPPPVANPASVCAPRRAVSGTSGLPPPPSSFSSSSSSCCCPSPLSLPHHAGHLAGDSRDERGPAPTALLRLDEGDVAAGRQLPHRGVEPVLEAAGAGKTTGSKAG